MEKSGSILGDRLKQLRLARGLSLDGLVEAMGSTVSKQSLSKYERGLSAPSEGVLASLSEALGIAHERLLAPSAVELVAFRKTTKLSQAETERIEELIRFALEERGRVETLIGHAPPDLPHGCFHVENAAAAEQAAGLLRRQWGLGTGPIANVVAVLEQHGIHVIEIDAGEGFDGLSAVARDAKRRPVALAVVSRRGVDGERQRLNLAHELGHLVMKLPDGVSVKDEESMAFRFGSAFLAPADSLRRDVGVRRRYISAPELLLLKRRYGMSVQALLYRLHVLEVINPESYKKWCMIVARLGWKKKEPEPWLPERSTWLERNVTRAHAEGALAAEDALRIFATEMGRTDSLTLLDKSDFRTMDPGESAKIVEQQVREMALRFRAPGSQDNPVDL